MSKKPVSLALHKNQIERRRRKELSQSMASNAKRMAKGDNVVAYTIVGLTSEGRAFAVWDTGGVVPMWAFPETVAEILRSDIADSNIDEDFKRPLIDRAWKGSQ